MLLNRTPPFYYIFNKIKVEIVYVILIALTVKFLFIKLQDYIPEMPLPIPAFLGTSISVLLSFKMNQSYDRWWEARKIWGSIVNDSRTLILQMQSFLNKTNNEAIKIIAYRQIAWCYSLGQSLRELDPLDNITHLMSTEDLQKLVTISNKPLGILQQNTLDFKTLKDKKELTDYNHVQISNTLARLVDSMGMAERINNTVFPVTYRKFLHFVIYLFVITLSLALGDIDSIFELPLLVLISSTFFFLEKSATHMQDPFNNIPSDTAMTSISNTIEINLKQLIDDKNIPETYKPESFYSL